MLPGVSFATATNEAALSTAIQTVAAANGWTVTNASTTPANSVWFQSSGEDGCSNVCGGLFVDTTNRQFRAFCAADIDSSSIISANVSGYVNGDATSAGHAINAETTLQWPARDNATSYSYAIVANRDAIVVEVVYTSSANSAQGLIYIGKVEAVGHPFQTQARAKIASVGAGSAGTQRLITLDRNITAMLKDTGAGGATFPNDPAQQQLFFQVVGGPSSDFASAERRQIVPGTLATSGGVTVFEVNVAAAGGTSKLFTAAQRYANNRGAGDIVRMHAEPNIAMAGANTSGSSIFGSGSNQQLASWDAFGGQSATVSPLLVNSVSNTASNEGPDPTSNRAPYYSVYMDINASVTSILAQSSNEGQKNVGRLYHCILVPNQSQPNFALFRINNDAARRYRVLNKNVGAGLALPGTIDGSSNVQFGVGPGW